jgi:hypothetical protein
VTSRLDFLGPTINEHCPESRSSFLTSTVLAVKTALLRSPEAFAELRSQQISDVAPAPLQLLPDHAEE